VGALDASSTQDIFCPGALAQLWEGKSRLKSGPPNQSTWLGIEKNRIRLFEFRRVPNQEHYEILSELVCGEFTVPPRVTRQRVVMKLFSAAAGRSIGDADLEFLAKAMKEYRTLAHYWAYDGIEGISYMPAAVPQQSTVIFLVNPKIGINYPYAQLPPKPTAEGEHVLLFFYPSPRFLWVPLNNDWIYPNPLEFAQ